MGINRPLPASRPTEKSVSHLEAQHVGLEKPHICCHTLHAGQIGCSKARRTPRRASAQTGSQSGRAPARAGSGSPPAPATPFAAAGPAPPPAPPPPSPPPPAPTSAKPGTSGGGGRGAAATGLIESSAGNSSASSAGVRSGRRPVMRGYTSSKK